jgi:outer membrane protein TolC
VALLSGSLLGGASSWASDSKTATPEAPRPDPPDLLDNKKVLETTVAALNPASPDAATGKPDGMKRGSGPHLTLAALWELAERRYPGLQAGRDAVRSARYTRDEQKWLRLPSGEFNGYLSWSPNVHCKTAAELAYTAGGQPLQSPSGPSGQLLGVGATQVNNNGSTGPCLETNAAGTLTQDSIQNYLPFYGALVRLDLRVIQPLYTFGKLDTALKLGNVGVALAQAQADSARADFQVNLLRAYFGIKAARAALYTVREGQEQIVKWVNQMDKDLESGKTNFTEIDLMRLKVTESAIEVQVIDAERIISSALAALRFLTQDANVDVDEEDLQLVGREDRELTYYLDAALRFRPELRTLKATGEGAHLYKRLRIAELLPDFGLIGTLGYGYAGGIVDPANAFMNHSNYFGFGIGLGMRLGLDFGPKAARLQKSIADINVFEARKREALGAGALEVERAYNDLHEAQQRLQASEKAERRARGWLQGIKQNIDVGTAESRDMTDALRTYFEQHVNVLRAINDVNVQAATLRRLSGLEVIPK